MKVSRAGIMIGISCAAALAAVVLASQWMQARTGLGTSRIAVAATDINLGTRLTADMVKLAEWPAGSVPAGAFVDLGKLDTRVTRLAVQRGEPLLESKLALPGATGGLSAVVGEGRRAMTVRVNDVVGVAGFALPGNYVDILVSTQAEKPTGDHADRSVSKLVLERILVLAVAQEASQNDTRPKVVNAVTLEVTPEQAEKLDLARSVGQLSLVLRNQIDMTPATTTGATKQTLLSGAKAAPEATRPGKAGPPAPAARKVETRPGTSARARQCGEVMTASGRITQCY
ncbi:MAG TPA: Flp pilus assembly protein CpaB [Noviherbaspirillum sp.]|jgi:pilus assembly protein CpaB|uniref:Flp pilus assembly protein CpaB n=1 Tax=Noviherbaspirillum sp. TaxID=1926288 RepID=UPI002F91E8C7